MNEALQQIVTFLHDQGLSRWVIALILSVVLTAVFKLALHLVVRNLKLLAEKTETKWDDILVEVIDCTKSWSIFIWLFYLQAHMFLPDANWKKTARDVVVLVTVFQVGLWGYRALKRWRHVFLDKRASADGSSAAALGLLYAISQGLFFTTIILAGLSNLGVDIGALLAGLGVGGIAVALAAQNVLGDLLASLSIVLDRPFVVGDFIILGKEMGTVEHIGLKTTRARSLSGEQIVFSNKDLLESRIHNFKNMWQRRVAQNIGVTYSTPPEKLEQIPQWMKEFVLESDKLTWDHCNLAAFGDSSLNFEFVYWVKDPDYNVYIGEQEKFMLKLIRKFAAEGVEFAFPTRTVVIEQAAKPDQGTDA